MGNQQKTCCSSIVGQDYPTVSFKQLRNKKQSEKNDPKKLFEYSIYLWLFLRFYQQPNQEHLFKVISSKKTIQQRNQFMDALYYVNIDLLDALFNSTKKISKTINNKSRKHFSQSKNASHNNLRSLKRINNQIFQKQITELTNQNHRYVKDCDCKIVDVNQFMAKNSLEYEKMKEVGLSLFRQKKVCCIILAGGKNHRFGKGDKQLFKLNTPSEKNMLEKMLHRYNALGQLIKTKIEVFILSNFSKQKQLKKFLRKIHFNKLQIKIMTQLQMGAFSQEGEVFLNDNSLPQLFPTGTGQIWDFFKDQQLFKFSQNKYKYIYLVGVSNALQHCFDCYQLGRMQCEGLSWTTKIVDSLGKNESKIFLNSKNQVQISDPQQIQFYPNQSTNTFTNHSIISVQFIQKVLTVQTQQDFRHFRKKTQQIDLPVYQKIKLSKTKQSSQEKRQKGHKKKIIHFETNFTDIFKLSQNYKLFKCSRYDQYYPFIFCKHKHSDLIHASRAIMELHKKWLNLPLTLKQNNMVLTQVKLSKNLLYTMNMYSSLKEDQEQIDQFDMCEVDPYVSLQGENLQQVKQDLKKESLQFPIYICLEDANMSETKTQ